MSNKKEYSQDVYDVGGKIRAARLAAGLSQDQLGEKLNISRKMISLYEISETEMGISKLFRIADVLQIPPQELFPNRYRNPEIDRLIHSYMKMNLDGRGMMLHLAKLLEQESEKSSE